MEINPQSSLIVPNGIISGDDRNPIYLGYGGMVTLLPFNSIYLSGLELWEESLGKIVDASNGADSIFLGSFETGHQLIFYIKDVSTGKKYYPELTTERMGETDELVQFYPSHIQGDPYPPDAGICLDNASSNQSKLIGTSTSRNIGLLWKSIYSFW